MHNLAKLDHQYVWHPFTQMRDWLQGEPIVIVEGQGAVLRDVHGREYLDANASIWTNLHGHNHPRINAAIQRQLGKIAHSSALGLANEPASLLAAELVRGVRSLHFTFGPARRCQRPEPRIPEAGPLAKVFFSDDGSTAMEVALKLAYEFARRTGRSRRPRFLSLEGGYHGDTVGAVSLGHIDLFHRAYAGLLFKSEKVAAPYCYRCPFNRAKPERADAREYRKCRWECVGLVEEKFRLQRKGGNPFAAMVVEPLIQGAAGMIPQPAGWLRRVAEIVRADGAQLLADEVLTGFGRMGRGFGGGGRWGEGRAWLRKRGMVLDGEEARLRAEMDRQDAYPGDRHDRQDGFPTGDRQDACPTGDRQDACPTLFACQAEGVEPDYLVLAKGLTGGYLPMAATLTTQAVFDAFLGDYAEFKTFFHGHSYTANQLGAAAALASLRLLQTPASIRARARLEEELRSALQSLWKLSNVGDIRQVGLVAGIELVRDWRTREPFDLHERAGIRVGEAMARRGVLTRPIGNVVVLMPPYCTTNRQVRRMVETLAAAVEEAFRARG